MDHIYTFKMKVPTKGIALEKIFKQKKWANAHYAIPIWIVRVLI